MHIADAMLHANSAGVVLSVLTPYIDAVRQDDLGKRLPDTCVDRGVCRIWRTSRAVSMRCPGARAAGRAQTLLSPR